MPTPYPFSSGATLLASQMNSLSQLPTVSITSNSTAVATHAYSRVIANGSAITYTIPNSVFEAGQVIQFHNINSTVCTIAAGAGVTLNGAAGLTVAQYQAATIYATSASSFLLFESAVNVTSGVIQVKSVSKTDTFTTTSTTFTDLTGLSVSITPTSASNKILVFYDVQGVGVSGTNMGGLVLVRDATTILQGDAAGSRSRVASILTEMSGAQITQASNSYIDSPATTSATTYKLQIRTLGAAGTTVYVNRTTTDTDLAAFGRSTSTMTVMEVAP